MEKAGWLSRTKPWIFQGQSWVPDCHLLHTTFKATPPFCTLWCWGWQLTDSFLEALATGFFSLILPTGGTERETGRWEEKSTSSFPLPVHALGASASRSHRMEPPASLHPSEALAPGWPRLLVHWVPAPQDCSSELLDPCGGTAASFLLYSSGSQSS